MLSKDGLMFFTTKLRRDFPFVREIHYDKTKDTLRIIILRKNSDEKETVCSVKYHLFLDQGYYEGHTETTTGSYDFAGMLCEQSHKQTEQHLKDYDNIRYENSPHFTSVLEYLELIGEYPCHVWFEYPQCEINFFRGDDAFIKLIEKRHPVLLPNDTALEIHKALWIFKKMTAKEKTRTSVFDIPFLWCYPQKVYYNTLREAQNSIRRFKRSFENITPEGQFQNFLCTINDGNSVNIKINRWNYENEEKKLENGKYPYDYRIKK